MQITYPQDFVEKVVQEYSEYPEVVELAKSNKFLLGKTLLEGATRHMAPEDIVRSFAEGKQQAVLEDAKSSIRRRELHRDWLQIMVKKVESITDEAPPSFRPLASMRAAKL